MSALLALWCRITFHNVEVQRGVARCARCGRRWVGRSYD